MNLPTSVAVTAMPKIIISQVIVAAAARRRGWVAMARSASSDVPEAPTPTPIRIGTSRATPRPNIAAAVVAVSDTSATATPLMVGQTLTGRVETYQDSDYFSFQAQAGHIYRIEETTRGAPQGAPDGGQRLTVVPELGGQRFMPFPLDVGVGDADPGAADVLRGGIDLSFANLAPLHVPAISVAVHVAALP